MDARLHVLIVDDAVDICQSLEMQLLDYGVFKASWCLSGEEALALIEKQPAKYDAIFIDLHMPGMDGLELMHRLSEMQYAGGVIIISALGARAINLTLEAVSNYHLRLLGSLEKPFDESLVAFMVRRIKNSMPNVSSQIPLMRRKDVLEALRDRQMVNYYQPQVSSIDNRVVGFECLARLNLNGEGLISANRFIAVAERFQLMDLILDSQMENLGREMASLKALVGDNCSFSLNLSAQQLYNDSLPEYLTDLAENYAIPIESLRIEVPENQAIMEDKQLKNIHRLSINGFNLSLDNYGLGYANLRQITRMPFGTVKLNAQMTEGIHNDKIMRLIVESIRLQTQIANIDLVALGVVHPEDLLALADINVDVYQGRLFCPSKSVEELHSWVPSWYESQTIKPWR